MWKSLPGALEYLKDVGGELIFNCISHFKTLPHLSDLPPQGRAQCMAEDCGLMKIVKTAGKSVFYRSWYEAVVKYIKDLTTEDGNFMTHFVFQHTFGVKTHFCSVYGF